MAVLATETDGTGDHVAWDHVAGDHGSGQIGAGTIREALGLARRHGFDEVELRSGESRFSATLLARRSAQRSTAGGTTSPPAAQRSTEVKSQNVGFVHLADLAPGTKVEEGARLATVETLGIANDLLAPRAGTLREFLVEDEAPVEFGQTVAVLEATA